MTIRWLAEWVGYSRSISLHPLNDHWFDPKGVPILEEDLPDFFTDEWANALLLEKMATKDWEIEVYWTMRTKWTCAFMKVSYLEAYRVYDPDRKTAIALAALKLIEAEKKERR